MESNNKKQHVMIDLESLGVDPGCQIISLGACKFTAEDGITDTFYSAVDLNEKTSTEYFFIDPSTLEWWNNQTTEARAVMYDQNALPINIVLEHFARWLNPNYLPKSDYPIVGLWGNGANFDNPILQYAYKRLKCDVPWPFYIDRCYRTMKALFKDVPFTRVGTYHNALDDAVTQATHLIDICKAKNITL